MRFYDHDMNRGFREMEAGFREMEANFREMERTMYHASRDAAHVAQPFIQGGMVVCCISRFLSPSLYGSLVVAVHHSTNIPFL